MTTLHRQGHSGAFLPDVADQRGHTSLITQVATLAGHFAPVPPITDARSQNDVQA